MKLQYGDRAAREVSERICAPMATIAAMKQIPADRRVHGMRAFVTDTHANGGGSFWRFHSTSALAGDDVLVATPTAGTGRWLREPGATSLVLPITFATADATALLTTPAGCRFSFDKLYWRVDVDWTGGASSTIGVSSNKTNFSTKGDLLGGAAGSLAAALTAAIGTAFGTIGTGFDTLAKQRVVWGPGDTIRHDRITSAFTTGSGAVVIPCNIFQNDGA